jgi:hypothetical protein
MLRTESKRVQPSGCGCGSSASQARPLVYVVGSLGFDYGSEARRDALTAANGGVVIVTDAQMAAFLATSPWEAASFTWTLSDDQYPLYAIRPSPAYGQEAYARLAELLTADVDRLSVPGWIAGSVRLMNGAVVPVIEPDVQGIRSWSVSRVAERDGSIDIQTPTSMGLPQDVNLDEQGTADWAYWGYLTETGYDRSDSGNAQIADFVASGAVARTDPFPQLTFQWSHGAPPHAQASGVDTAVRVSGLNDGFKFTVPADTQPRILTLYVSATSAEGTLVAALGDDSAEPAVVTTTGDGPFSIRITYKGGSATQLVVSWSLSRPTGDSPAIVLQAATLARAEADPRTDLQNFMDRIYFELRSKGASPEERARNFAATQAYFTNNVIAYAIGHGLNLQRISVAHSPLCRPGSECWDVTLAFFDPQNPTQSALKVFRFTVDVSDVKPVMIGPMYEWNSY